MLQVIDMQFPIQNTIFVLVSSYFRYVVSNTNSCVGNIREGFAMPCAHINVKFFRIVVVVVIILPPNESLCNKTQSQAP
jgi:hypothetical protein